MTNLQKIQQDKGSALVESFVFISIIGALALIALVSLNQARQNEMPRTAEQIKQQLYYNCVKMSYDDSSDAKEIIDTCNQIQ